MRVATRSMLAGAGAVVLGLALLPTAAGASVPTGSAAASGATLTSGAPSRVVRACVRKSSGRVRIVSAGPCRRGERLVTWNRRGAAGPAGAVGPAGAAGGTIRVTDATGAQVMGVVYTDGSRVAVLIGSGIYDYTVDGRVAVSEGFPRYWVGATCSGTSIVPFANPSSIPGGPMRVVLPNADGVTASAYAFGVTVTLTAGSVVSVYNGTPPVCTPIVVPTDTEVQTLVLVGAPPPNLPGPLTISLT